MYDTATTSLALAPRQLTPFALTVGQSVHVTSTCAFTCLPGVRYYQIALLRVFDGGEL